MEQPRRRPSHRVFDRPRQPHDWRWVVGGIGRAFIVIGLLMFAFVAYQLWGTGIYTAQAQNRLDTQFAGLSRPAGPVTTTSPAATSSPASAPTAPADPVPADPVPAGTAPAGGTEGGRVPTEVRYPFDRPAEGDALVRIEIPRLDLNYVVVEGVALGDLAKGPGHFPESVLPGELGNAAIAGHRTTHGAPFADVDKLRPGDEIVISYPAVGGTTPRFVYRVTGTTIVSPSDYAAVVPTTDPTRATLVLASCHPKRTSSQRIIVSSELATGLSSPVFAPTALPTVAPDATIPTGDDPAGSQSTAAVDGSTEAADTGNTGSTAASSIPDASTVDVAAGTPAIAAPATSVDAFSSGWFDDTGAWPPIILWGLALAAITFGGYLLARGYRRIWLGTLAAAVPFVVVLYFWFENINRMLPAGL